MPGSLLFGTGQEAEMYLLEEMEESHGDKGDDEAGGGDEGDDKGDEADKGGSNGGQEGGHKGVGG